MPDFSSKVLWTSSQIMLANVMQCSYLWEECERGSLASAQWECNIHM